ncbi:MAG: hypothetical protein ACLQBX_18895 [Candidatus Limnocylindrales bacterium]
MLRGLDDGRPARPSRPRQAGWSPRPANPYQVSIQRRGGANPEDRRAALDYGREVARQGCDHLVLVLDPRSGPDGLRLLADEVARPLRDEFGV